MLSAFLYLGIVLMWLCVLVPMWLRYDRHTVDIDDLYEEGEEGEESDGSAESDGDTLCDVPVHEIPAARAPLDADADDEVTVELAPAEPRAEQRAEPRTERRTESRADQRADARSEQRAGLRGHASDASSPAERDAQGPAEASGPVAPPVSGVSEQVSDVPSDGSSGSPSGINGKVPPIEFRRRASVMARRRRWLLWSVLLHIASLVTAAVGVAPWWSVAPSVVLLVSYLAVLRVAVGADTERRAEAARARAERERQEREHRLAVELAAQQAEAEIIEFRRRVEPFDQYADRTRRAVGD
ncbi:hypothetical protein [Sphaerisporangium corydalis]|uniref:Uncharacterized protein n=1 Tax=Sphaerisporangium corydalis TaxID=1441875 RepID=A0ABV9ETL5_9ACTN|nr:hypothetical protein [Sphaerisporangium corydalis]